MFDQSLIEKVMFDSRWRRDTALGCKIASRISVGDCLKLWNKVLDEPEYWPEDSIDWNDEDCYNFHRKNLKDQLEKRCYSWRLRGHEDVNKHCLDER